MLDNSAEWNNEKKTRVLLDPFQVLNDEEHKQAEESNYNFDHPNAFDFDLLQETLARLREGKSCEVPVYDFTTHARDHNPKVWELISSFKGLEFSKMYWGYWNFSELSDTRLKFR